VIKWIKKHVVIITRRLSKKRGDETDKQERDNTLKGIGLKWKF